jgi:hypothetical protein
LDEFWAGEQKFFDLFKSTGLYAKAGTIVEVTLAKDLIGKIKVILKPCIHVILLK